MTIVLELFDVVETTITTEVQPILTRREVMLLVFHTGKAIFDYLQCNWRYVVMNMLR